MTKDKVRGCFLGVGIGDSLGLCCEGWTSERIKEVYGRITTYQNPKGHKYNDGVYAGSISDDTQLTISTAEALIEGGGIDLDMQVKHHIKAYKMSVAGWGTTTREAVEKLSNGTHWSESGVYLFTEGQKPRGFGNGLPMKSAPLGIFLSARPFDYRDVSDKLADFSGMTHPTSMSVSSCLAHVFAVFRCMTSDTFSISNFITTVVNASELGKKYYPDTANGDDITERFNTLHDITVETKTEDIINNFGKGTYYVYNSLPFAYAFFVRNPRSIESLYDCVNGGGDCDSNGSMLGGLLGALNGTAIFPKHLVDGLSCKNELIKLADKFSERFGI